MANLILQGAFERFRRGSITVTQPPIVRIFAFNPIIPDYRDRVSVGFGGMVPLQFTRGQEAAYFAGPHTVVLTHSDAVNFRSGRIFLDTGGAFLVGSLTRFSTKPLAGHDPEYLYVQGPTAANSGAVGAAWTRHSAKFALPKHARYLAVGGRFHALPVGNSQHIKDVQVERAPIGDPAPTAYTPARSVYTRIGPDRLNYSPNPNFDNDTLTWSGLTRQPSGGRFVGVVNLAAGGSSEILHTIPDLQVGKTYALALTVSASRNIRVTPFVSSGATMYQGTPIEAVGSERRLVVSFTTTDTTVAVGALLQGTTEAAVVTVKDAIVEEGDRPGEYFDGSSGEDYLWETGGTPGSARSYFYKGRIEKHAMIKRILASNVPLGIGIAEPQFGVLPTRTL